MRLATSTTGTLTDLTTDLVVANNNVYLTICCSVLCVLIVEGMSVVVNVMLSLMNVMDPPPALCDLSVCAVVNLCSF